MIVVPLCFPAETVLICFQRFDGIACPETVLFSRFFLPMMIMMMMGRIDAGHGDHDTDANHLHHWMITGIFDDDAICALCMAGNSFWETSSGIASFESVTVLFGIYEANMNHYHSHLHFDRYI